MPRGFSQARERMVEGYGGAGEVKRPALPIHCDLNAVGVGYVGLVRDGRAGGCDVETRAHLPKSRQQRFGAHERFIALEIDYEFLFGAFSRLIDAVRAGNAFIAGYNGIGADAFRELQHPFILGCYEHRAQPRFDRGLVAPLKHGLAANLRQNFAWKAL